MKLSSIRRNGKAIEEGAWVDANPHVDGIRLRVRGLYTVDRQRLETKLIRDVPEERRFRGLDPEDAREIEARCLSEVVLLDWENIEDDNDQPILFSIEKAYEFFSSPDYDELRDAVRYAASAVGRSKAADQERDAGN